MIYELVKTQKETKMSISGITENEYAKFLENGGNIRITIDKSNIMSESDFETSGEIRSNLLKASGLPLSS